MSTNAANGRLGRVLGHIHTETAADASDSNHAADLEEEKDEYEVKVMQDPDTKDWNLESIPHVVSFDQGFFYTVCAIQLLQEKRSSEKMIVVSIAGPTGAGKSLLAEKIVSVFPGSLILPLDHFILLEEVESHDGSYDDPSFFDFDRVLSVLDALKQGESVTIPRLSASRNRRLTDDHVSPPSSGIIIVEGMYALNARLRPSLDVTLAINGGVHFDLIKRVMRDTAGRLGDDRAVSQRDTIFQITNVVFPMFKVYIEPDTKFAKIRIHSRYDPMKRLVNPTYVCKAELSHGDVPDIASLVPLVNHAPLTQISDMYLYPPKYNPDSVYQADLRNWIRIRRMEGVFYINFYNEQMDPMVNVRPSITFEISVKTISGLLSLGYQIGAILNRTMESWSSEDGSLEVTLDVVKELGKRYIQVKGTDRGGVLRAADKLCIKDHHVSRTFLQLYFANQAARQEKASP